MSCQPGAHLGVLVRGVVVYDCMDCFSGWNLCLDGVEEADELLMTMALHVRADHGAVEHIKSGEQRRGAVAFIVVGHSAGAPPLHRQTGLSAVQRLDLALLIH